MNMADQAPGQNTSSQPDYDIVIVGGGPAGLTAALYAARDKLSVLIVEKAIMGGLITETDRIDNYPGFPDGISGFDLTDKMLKQAQRYGVRDISAEVMAVEQTKRVFVVRALDSSYSTRAVIIAGGSEHLKLGVPGEKEYTGRGVSYCATCDAPFFADKVVAVVGGGDTALYEAMHLAKFTQKVFVIHRRSEYRATPIVQDAARGNPKIEHVFDTVIEAVAGGDFVEKVRLRHIRTGETSELLTDGLFVAVGLKPNTSYLQGLLELDADAAIIVDEHMATSVPGIYAAGDIRRHSVRQTVSAAGDGAVAALAAKKWLEEISVV